MVQGLGFRVEGLGSAPISTTPLEVEGSGLGVQGVGAQGGV
jgi:hypothetical protein